MTGWGSAVNTADVRPGDTVVVIGFGGIGSGAVQGARLAGAEKIIVVEPIEAKRDKAFQFGATALRDLDRRGDRAGRRPDPRGDGGLCDC